MHFRHTKHLSKITVTREERNSVGNGIQVGYCKNNILYECLQIKLFAYAQ